MIDFTKAKELRIKRANTDWWINEKAIVAANGLTYIAYVTDMGEIHIKELDAKCSKTPSRDFRLRKLNYNYADDAAAANGESVLTSYIVNEYKYTAETDTWTKTQTRANAKNSTAGSTIDF